MNSTKKLTVPLLLLALQTIVQGQQAAKEDDSDFVGEVSVTAPFANQSAAFESELQRTNYLDAGLGVTTSFDDNTLNTPENGKSDFTYAILPHLELRQSYGRAGWKLNYDGGYILHQHLNVYNQGAHDLGVEGSYRLTEHLNATVANRLWMTTGFFNQLLQGPNASPGTILEQPNATVVTPISDQKSNTALIRIDDQLSPTNGIGSGATFFRSHYDNAPSGAALMDTDSQEAELYFNHLLSPRSAVGVTYRFLRLTFIPVASDATVNSLLATYTLRPRRDMVFTFFGGPQRTTLEEVAPLVSTRTKATAQKQVSGTGGASFVWNGRITGLSASLTRATSDGGGLLGPVTLTMASSVLRRQIARGLTTSIGFSYGLSDPLGIGTTASSLKTRSVSAAIEHNVKAWVYSLGYARVAQQQNASTTTIQDITHDRVWISISYHWTQMVGTN
jgi:hypothetical protein